MIKITTTFALVFLTLNMIAQNLPVFQVNSSNKIFSKTGNNVLIIPEVNDGELINSQPISFTAQSSDVGLLTIDSIVHKTGNGFALLYCKEKGVNGTVTVAITATDVDGPVSKNMTVSISDYTQKGLKFSLYDIVFWQNAVPTENDASVYDTIIQQTNPPYDELDFSKIALTVGPTMGGPKSKYYTSTMTGYLIPSTTGDYSFSLSAPEPADLYLSPNSNMNSKVKLISDSWGTVDPTSSAQHLIAGEVYAFYVVQYVIESHGIDIKWTGPGISSPTTISGTNFLYMYDVIKPSAPSNLILKTATSNEMLINWSTSTDNKTIDGYNVYVNGIKNNVSLVKTLNYTISNLQAATNYSVFVRAVDKVGNESNISNTINAKTFIVDALPPTAPAAMQVLAATGQSIKIKWSGASDAQTVVVAYNIYVNDVKVNTNYVYADSFIISGLTQRTNYSIKIEAVDASYNISPKSIAFSASTKSFDPYDQSLGDKRARVSVSIENISYNEGIGINPPFDASLYNATMLNILNEMKPGVIRWGTLGANPVSLSQASGTGKDNTYGRMLNLANTMGSYFALSMGIQDATDFRTNPQTFANLLEYLNGPSTSTWGAKRAAEGFADPLLTNSKGIILEFGCEVWGGAGLHNAEIGADYIAYGKWCRDMAKIIKASPYYDSKKITLAYSGRNPSPLDSYGLNNSVMTGDTGDVECITVSGYLGGNMNFDPGQPMGSSELEYLKYRIDHMRLNLEGLKLSITDQLALTGTIKQFYFYESNATTSSYNGRLGQAIIMTDYMTESMKYGSIVPSVFHINGGEWRITQPENNNKRLPLYLTSKYINTWCKGNILTSKVETNNTITSGDGNIMNFNPVGTSAYNNGGNYSVVFFSRDFENDYTVQLNLPNDFIFNSNAKKYILSGSNFSTYDMTIDSSNITLQDSMFITVPKYSMVLIRFTGENRNLTPIPMGTFARTKAKSISIVPQTDSVININKAAIKLTAVINPSDVFFTNVTWKFLPTTVLYYKGITGNVLTITGNGKCNGNGSFKVVAFCNEDPTITDTITVVINNQQPVAGCPNDIEETEINEISVFPNPASSNLSIESGINIETIQIVDMTGIMVYNDIPLKEKTEVNTSSLKTGIYMVIVKTKKGIHTTRIIKE